MGHTLVAEFDQGFNGAMDEIFRGQNNKIPFGRDCDRNTANQCLPYHMTLFHWAKDKDEIYLPQAKKLIFRPCSINIIGASVLRAEEDSHLLILNVEPSKDFNDFILGAERLLGKKVPTSFHITLAVDKDENKVKQMYNELYESFIMPCDLSIRALGLYHIWKPVKKIQEYSKQ